jgi:hypothetical protein
MKKYIELVENEKATHIRVELRYNLGGYSMATYKEESRGYYLHVTPVTRYERDGIQWEQFTAFTGVKQCVLTVSRKSAKAEREAEEKAARIENVLVSWVCEENNLQIREALHP